MLNLRLAFTLALLALGLSLPAQAAFTGYLKLPDIDGESEREGFEGWIVIEAMNYTVDSPLNDYPTLERIKVLKKLDKASPQIFDRCVNSTVLNDIEIAVQMPDEEGFEVTVFTYELDECVITSITTELINDELMEVISLTPAKLSIEYAETGSSSFYDFSIRAR